MTIHPNDATDEPDVFARQSYDFHRRVLDRLPTALIVVDEAGSIVYGNEALHRLSGWHSEEGVGSAIYEYIHPDDLEWLADAFLRLADRDSHAPDIVDRPWVPIHFRLVARSGHVIPVEVVGNGSLHDPDVRGVIYEVRPAHEREIFQRVLSGVASGGDLAGQLALVVELISGSDLGIRSAVTRTNGDRVDVLGTGDDAMLAMLSRAGESGELDVFPPAFDSPHFTDATSIPGSFGSQLGEHGFVDAWNIDVESAADQSMYRVLGFTDVHHIPAMGVRDRLTRAAELVAIITLRQQNDQLLDRAAHHDALTGLANTLGLRRYVDGVDHDAIDERPVVLFVDLDGFKAVNDSHGHRHGDEVLVTIARRLVATIGPLGVAARLGGDEFAVVLAAGSTDSTDVAARILSAIEAPIRINGRHDPITASIGVVEMAPGVDLDAVIDQADRAMYAAKRAGGGRLSRGEPCD